MFPDSPFSHPVGSFVQPVAPVQADYSDAPTVPLEINQTYIPYILGALQQLILQSTYPPDISPADLNVVQGRWQNLMSYIGSASVEDKRPFYQSEEEAGDVENTSGQLWYEPAGDWVIEAFLASTFTPLAAIVYAVFIPKLRLTLRAHDLGASFMVLLDGLEVLTGDSYSPIKKLIEIVVDVQEFAQSHNLGNGDHELKIQMLPNTSSALSSSTLSSLSLTTAKSLQVCLGDIRPVDTGFSSGADSGGEDMIRQDPDNPCLLQSSVDGTNWCTFADLSKCFAQTGQTGAPQPQPPVGGGQQCYHVILNVNGQYNVGVLVSTGDVVTLSNQSGAHSNSYDVFWELWNGDQYFGGLDVGNQQYHSTDPLPSTANGAVIAIINGTPYPFSSMGTLTVASGISNAELILQVNDQTIAGLSGQLTFDACVTNNAVASWSSTLDFTANPYSAIVVIDVGAWVGGSGYKGTVQGSAPNYAQIHINTGAFVMTSASVGYLINTPIGSGSGVVMQYDGTAYITDSSPTTNTPDITGNIASVSVTSAVLVVVDSGTGGTGTAFIQKLILSGTGTKPSVLP